MKPIAEEFISVMTWVAAGCALLVGMIGIHAVSVQEQTEVCQAACGHATASLERHDLSFESDKCFCDGKFRRTF